MNSNAVTKKPTLSDESLTHYSLYNNLYMVSSKLTFEHSWIIFLRHHWQSGTLNLPSTLLFLFLPLWDFFRALYSGYVSPSAVYLTHVFTGYFSDQGLLREHVERLCAKPITCKWVVPADRPPLLLCSGGGSFLKTASLTLCRMNVPVLCCLCFKCSALSKLKNLTRALRHFFFKLLLLFVGHIKLILPFHCFIF